MANRFRALVLAILACLCGGPAYAQRPYSVDDMLAVESFGRVSFDPAGERLIFERFGPYDRQSDYGRFFVIGETRSRIYTVDLGSDAAPALLFDQVPGEGYTDRGLSPDGRFLAINHVSAGGLSTGVVPLSGGAPRMFDVAPVYAHIPNATWFGQRLVVGTVAPGEVDSAAALGAERIDELVALWRHRRRGDRPTASRIGSGRFADPPERSGALVLADAETGRTTSLAAGRFTTWHASADGSALAALREERLELAPGQRMEHGANLLGIQRRLLILVPNGAGQADALDACPRCDILPMSLNWSAAAPLLSFAARDRGEDWAGASVRIFDRRSGRTRAIELPGLRPHVSRVGAQINISTTWLGDRLVVLAERSDAPADARGVRRADWYLIGEGAPRNLTGDFSGATPELAGLGRKSLILLHDGDAWQVDGSGNRRNLTADIAGRVTAWRAPGPLSIFPLENRQPSAVLPLQVQSRGEAGQLLFLDTEGGTVEALIAPSANSTFLAATPAARRAALAERSGNSTRLMVVGTDGLRREIAEINTHLRDVIGGTPVRIDHSGPGGDARMSWILLPPGFRSGRPVPTIVNVYPGGRSGEGWTRSSLDDVSALNPHILAARGYAVLFPSLPLNVGEVPRDPLDGLADDVFAAVDAAVAAGYADPERLAVQGQSFGAYAAAGLIGVTDRFRSAVASAGTYDLVSSYGQFDIRRRLDMEQTGLDLFSSSLMETGQFGLGAPPWEDPQRYLRNSPIMNVRDINTPILLLTGDLDYVSTTQTEEFFTALTRLNRDAVMIRYYGEDHVYNSPANIRDMWRQILEWLALTLEPRIPQE